MPLPKNKDLVCWRNSGFPSDAGDQYRLVLNGAVQALTGKTLTLQVRLRDGADGDPLVDLTSADSSGDYIKVDDAANGTFRIVIRAATLGALPAPNPVNPPRHSVETFVYDLKLDGEVWAYGLFKVHTGVTL